MAGEPVKPNPVPAFVLLGLMLLGAILRLVTW